MIGCEEDSHAATTEEDAEDLYPLVSDPEEEKRDDHYAYNRPEVEELSGQEVSVLVCEDGKVVS